MLTQESASGPVTSARVRRAFERQADSTVVLHLATGEAIEATAEHPFYVAGRGFVAAQAVGIGTAIVTRAGPAVRVVGVERQAGRVRMYNLEVEGGHTYFVGKTGAWVHNACEYVYRLIGEGERQAIENARGLVPLKNMEGVTRIFEQPMMDTMMDLLGPSRDYLVKIPVQNGWRAAIEAADGGVPGTWYVRVGEFNPYINGRIVIDPLP